jgi:cell division protein FtsN
MATVKSEAAALREWKRLQAKHNLKGMKSQIKESETTDGEIVYRLLMGPFEEKVKAMKYAVKIDGTKVVHITE